MIQAKPLADLPGVQHRFFTRKGGISAGLYSSLNCGYGSGDDATRVRENRTRVGRKLGVEHADVLSVYLPPRISLGLVGDIAAARPREVWLNPGADAPEVVAALVAEGLSVRQQCSIIELGFSPSLFS